MMAPSVRGIEKDYDGRAHVERVNFFSDTGKKLRKRYGVAFTPTFVLVDGRGATRQKVFGVVSEKRLRSELNALLD